MLFLKVNESPCVSGNRKKRLAGIRKTAGKEGQSMEKLQIVYLPPGKLTAYERNARKHSPDDIEAIKKSILEDGFNDPIGIWGENNVIVDCKFKTFGCGAAIATSSMATELIKGKTVDEALQLTNKAVVEALDGLPAVKVHCSVLAEEAVKSAVADYYKKNNIPFDAKLLECTEEGCCHLAAHGEEH